MIAFNEEVSKHFRLNTQHQYDVSPPVHSCPPQMFLGQRSRLSGGRCRPHPGQQSSRTSLFLLLTSLLQNLFAEKIKEYGDKKAKAGGKLVDATAATNAELQAELDKVKLD